MNTEEARRLAEEALASAPVSKERDLLERTTLTLLDTLTERDNIKQAARWADELARDRRLRIEELESALGFYADVKNYWSYYDGELDDSDIARDGGDRANAALSKAKE